MPTQPIKKGAGQTPAEMAAQMVETQAGNRMYENSSNRRGNYKEISDQLKAEALDTAISQQMQLLKTAKERGRIDLNNLDEVEATAKAYMQACKISGTFPTFLGFSAACGISRMTLYRYIDAHDNATTRYLDSLRSSWASIIAQMGLSRQCSESVAIFLLKNTGQGMSDKAEFDVTAKPADPLRYDVTPEDAERFAKMLSEKYADLPED